MGGGHELIFQALQHAKKLNHEVCIILNSSLTDMAAVIDDPRWEHAKAVVSCVVAMGGVVFDDDGKPRMDDKAANNAFDVKSATRVYEHLQEASWPSPKFLVVSRFAAGACQMPRKALDGAGHPVALRFVGVSEPGLQKLWERSHRTKEEREEAKDALPMRCDPAWFKGTFLREDIPETLGAKDRMWEYVKGFNEYDGLTAIVGITACCPGVLSEFFDPHSYDGSNLQVVGVSAEEHNIVDPPRMSELLHDCLVRSFGD